MNGEPHEHDHRPLLHLRDGHLVWERQLTMQPRYPFRCGCGDVIWRNAEHAAAERLVFLAEVGYVT